MHNSKPNLTHQQKIQQEQLIYKQLKAAMENGGVAMANEYTGYAVTIPTPQEGENLQKTAGNVPVSADNRRQKNNI